MKMYRRLVAGLAVGLVSVACGTTQAAVMLVNDFDSDLESWRFDFGPAGAISYDATEGSPGNATGAARLDMTFVSGSPSGNAFTGDVFFPEIDLSGYDTLEFDVLVAPGSAVDGSGNNGFLEFVTRETGGYNFVSVFGTNLAPAAGWQTFSVPTSAMLATRAFTLQLFGEAAGDVTLFLDNIRLTAIPEPSTALITFTVLAACCAPMRRCS